MFKSFKDAQAHHKALGITPGDPLSTSILDARRHQDQYFESLKGQMPEVGQVLNQCVDTSYGSMNIRLIYPKENGPFGYIVFVRGAGWWAGNLDSHMQTMTTLANATSMVVCGVDYYKAPEYHYPTQVNQVIEALDHLNRNQIDLGLNGKGFLFGESAGATIALSVAQSLRDQDKPILAGLILFYCNADGFKPKAREYSQWVWLQYMGVSQPVIEHDAVPLQRPVDGLVPIWIGVGEDDALIGDSLKLKNQLTECGASPIYRVFPGLPHGFLMWTAVLEPALDALGEACDVLKGWRDSIR